MIAPTPQGSELSTKPGTARLGAGLVVTLLAVKLGPHVVTNLVTPYAKAPNMKRELLTVSGAVRVALAVLCLGCCHAVSGMAQDVSDTAPSRRRSGFWFSLGIGYGRLDFGCAGGTDGPWQEVPPAASCPQAGAGGATGGIARIGYALSDKVLVALATNGWRRVGMDEGGWTIGLSGQVYPISTADAFVELGVGHSDFRRWQPDGPDEVGDGLGVFGGIGYDVRAGENLSLTAAIRAQYGYQGDVGFGGVLHFADGSQLTSRTNVHETWLGLTFGITFH